jgi:predicted amidophosphoribosyltransferase
MELTKKIKQIKNFVLDLIFPKICLGCQQEGSYLCPQCLARIPLVDKFSCLGCGKVSLYGQTCEDCKNKIYLAGLIYAFNYSSPLINQSIKLLKYHGLKEVINSLAEPLIMMIKNSQFLINPVRNANQILVKGIKSELTDNSNEADPVSSAEIYNGVNFPQSTENFLIIPVPLHSRKFRWRGFNQSELLAKKLADEFDLPLDNKILIKIKNTRSQTELKESERKINIKDSFEARPVRNADQILVKDIKSELADNSNKVNPVSSAEISNGVKGKIIFLIDDVSTTGSTLNEAAKVLKKSGAAQVWGITIAKG